MVTVTSRMGPACGIAAGGSVLVFGGPNGNRLAANAVIEEARRRNIPPHRVICTGDLTAAFPGVSLAKGSENLATLDLVRHSGIVVVLGDTDAMLAEIPDAELSPEQRAWLAALPKRIEIEIGDLTFTVLHGGHDAIDRALFASTPAMAKRRELDACGTDGILAGHCGLPFTQSIDGRLWHNAGTAGIPAHDGTPRIWCSVIAPSNGGVEIRHIALDYDHASAAASLRSQGWSEAKATSLATGIWPATDLLPLREIHAGGVALTPGKCHWRPDEETRKSRRGAACVRELWPIESRDARKALAVEKFKHPHLTAKGEPRAQVALRALDTLWFNTGTLCNITCRNCYIESGPKNDRLVYLTLADVERYLDEIERDGLPTREIGFTGGEPFMNPHLLAILEACLERGFEVLVLTNAMRPMQRHKKALLELKERFGGRFTLRVSLDHFRSDRHEEERGIDTFTPAMTGLKWLSDHEFDIAVAGRSMWGEDDAACRAGFARLFERQGVKIDAEDPRRLVLFPEMDSHLDVPEITTACWGILHKSPNDMMCATSRMVVRRKGADAPAVLACTLLAYDEQFELGTTLKQASRAVPLNHAHCAKFCVLGGASCSAAPAASPSPEARAPEGRFATAK